MAVISTGASILVSTWFQRTGKSDHSLEIAYPRQKLFQFEHQQYRQYALISDFWTLSKQEDAVLATNWIKDRLEGLKLQSLAVATMTNSSCTQSIKYNCRCTACFFHKCESWRSGKQLIFHGNPSTIAKYFFQHMIVLRCHFLPNMSFHGCMLLQGTLRGNVDIFAASDDSTAWVLFWKTRSTPIGVRVCLVA